MDNKTDLRIKFKALRRNLNIEAVSFAITNKLREFDIYKSATNIMIFYPTKYEIDVRDLCEDKSKKFYLPKVEADKLLVCPYSKWDKLEISSFNISEPCSNPVSADILDLIIVPALAVDKNNYRLGYGGGFYDRFLAQYPDVITVVPISKNFIVESLPVSKFDVKVDFVITD